MTVEHRGRLGEGRLDRRGDPGRRLLRQERHRRGAQREGAEQRRLPFRLRGGLQGGPADHEVLQQRPSGQPVHQGPAGPVHLAGEGGVPGVVRSEERKPAGDGQRVAGVGGGVLGDHAVPYAQLTGDRAGEGDVGVGAVVGARRPRLDVGAPGHRDRAEQPRVVAAADRHEQRPVVELLVDLVQDLQDLPGRPPRLERFLAQPPGQPALGRDPARGAVEGQCAGPGQPLDLGVGGVVAERKVSWRIDAQASQLISYGVRARASSGSRSEEK